jgi:Ser/Thr protein kinase RdoA (MazF antagonist)
MPMTRDISHLVPVYPDRIDSTWVADALGPDLLGRCSVEAVEVRRVGQEHGHLGSSYMVDVRYAGDASGLPVRFVVKLPSPSEESLQTALRGNLYEREYRFFTELAEATPVRAPRCWSAGLSADGRAFVLLLEDVSGRRELDQVEGCTVEFAAAVLRELARMHARWWAEPQLAELTWLTRFSNPRRVANLSGLAERGWPRLLESMSDDQAARVREAGTRVLADLAQTMASLDEQPQTLLHGDPRLDNLMSDAGPNCDPVALLDWQNVSRGPGVCDVAYFLVQSMSVADLTTHLETLAEVYLDELGSNGVLTPSLRDFLQSFLAAMPMSFAVASSLAEIGDLGSGRTRRLAHAMAERAAATVAQIEALRNDPEVIPR